MTRRSQTTLPDAESQKPDGLLKPAVRREDSARPEDGLSVSELVRAIDRASDRAVAVQTPVESSVSPHVLHGVCNICGWKGSFQQPEGGREGHHCTNCASTSRHRMVVHGLSTVMKMSGYLTAGDSAPLYAWPRDPRLRILEPSGRGAYPTVLDDRFQYFGIEFDPARVDASQPSPGYGDIQRLHHADESFDVVIASDVFEHVRDDDAGYAEIHRVLEPGGALVLTVPYEHAQRNTVERVDTSGETDVQVLPPVYHAGGGQTLVYRDYGRDLLTKLRRVGFTVVHVNREFEGSGITRQSLILAFKQDFLEGIPGAPVTDATHPSNTSALSPLLPHRLYLLMKFNLRGFAQLARATVTRILNR